MSTLIKSPKDFWTGVIYVVLGGTMLLIAQAYTMGTASRMGPGYFPRVLAGLLMVFGAASLVRSFKNKGPGLGKWAIIPALWVTGATVAFGLLLSRAGIVIALLVLCLGSAAASSKFRFEWKALFAMIGLIVFCVLVFVKGLGMPIPILGSWFGG